MTEITRQEVQAYVAHLVSNGYAPRTTNHIHDVLSAVLRTAVKWGHLQDNPARELGERLLVRGAVYDGMFSTPKTAAGVRPIPLSEAAVQLTVDWRARVKHTEPESLMFATWSGKPISPNNVLRRWIVPACETLGLQRVT